MHAFVLCNSAAIKKWMPSFGRTVVPASCRSLAEKAAVCCSEFTMSPAIRNTRKRHKFLYPSTGGFLGCCWRLPPGYMNYNTASAEAHKHADV